MPGLELGQNPAWDLNPRGWDTDPAKTHGAWFQDLMKLRFLMSHSRKNSMRDKVIGSVQFSSVAQLCLTLCNPMDCSMPGFSVHHLIPELAQTHVHQVGMPSNHLILYCPLLLLPPIPPSIRVFSNESTL